MFTEKTLLKREARKLRQQINQANALIRQRQKIKGMRGRLEDLQYQLQHPEWNNTMGEPIA